MRRASQGNHNNYISIIWATYFWLFSDMLHPFIEFLQLIRVLTIKVFDCMFFTTAITKLALLPSYVSRKVQFHKYTKYLSITTDNRVNPIPTPAPIDNNRTNLQKMEDFDLEPRRWEASPSPVIRPGYRFTSGCFDLIVSRAYHRFTLFFFLSLRWQWQSHDKFPPLLLEVLTGLAVIEFVN